MQNLKTTKTDKALKFVFVSEQNNTKVPENLYANDKIRKKILRKNEKLNKFAPEKAFSTLDTPKYASLITNKIRKVIVKGNKMFQK